MWFDVLGLALEEVRLAWSPEHFSKSFRNPHVINYVVNYNQLCGEF